MGFFSKNKKEESSHAVTIVISEFRRTKKDISQKISTKSDTSSITHSEDSSRHSSIASSKHALSIRDDVTDSSLEEESCSASTNYYTARSTRTKTTNSCSHEEREILRVEEIKVEPDFESRQIDSSPSPDLLKFGTPRSSISSASSQDNSLSSVRSKDVIGTLLNTKLDIGEVIFHRQVKININSSDLHHSSDGSPTSYSESRSLSSSEAISHLVGEVFHSFNQVSAD